MNKRGSMQAMALNSKKWFKSAAAAWVCCLTVFLSAYLVFLMPQERAKAQLAGRLAQRRSEAALARQNASEHAKDGLEREVAALQGALDQFVMDPSQAAYLPFEISQIGRNMDIGSLSLTNTDREGFLEIDGCNRISAKPLHLSFTASFNRFAGFLNAIERCRPAIFLDTFSIACSPREAAGHQVDMKLLVLVPDRKAKQKRPGASASADREMEP